MTGYQTRDGKTAMVVYAWRFVSGRPMNGAECKTNSTFFRYGDRDLSPRQNAMRWSFLPGYARALWRVGTVSSMGITGYGFIEHPTATIATLSAATGSATIYGGWRTYRRVKNYTHYRKRVRPLYLTLAAMTGTSFRDRPERHLQWPSNYLADTDTQIRYTLPDTFPLTEQSMAQIHRIVKKRLGGSNDWDVSAFAETMPQFIVWKAAPEPPRSVPFADIRSAILSADVSEIVLGIGARGSIVKVDLDSEAPHIAVSSGTGGGKSALLRSIIAQLSRRGIRIDIIDPKFISQNWASDLPGVRIHRSVESQMKCVAQFKDEMDKRYQEIGSSDEEFDFPRRVLIIEEYNSWIDDLKSYWRDYRNSLTSSERSTVARMNPAISDIGFILNKGRAAKVNVIGVWQRFSANATGGADMRENFGARILLRYSHQTFKMLTSAPYVKSSRIAGRGILIFGDETTKVQLAFLTKQEARNLAMGSWPGEIVRDSETSGIPVPEMPSIPEPEYYTINEASNAGKNIIPMSPFAIYRARERKPNEFPEGKQIGGYVKYTAEELSDWYENRVSTVRKTDS